MELLKLKTNQAPVYNLCWSLGLVGPLPEATAPETLAGFQVPGRRWRESSWRGSPRPQGMNYVSMAWDGP